jgi:hypothetical protein
MRETTAPPTGPRTVARGFEAIADAIMYRWAVERDTWVSPTEIEQTRAYLARVGVPTRSLPDGRFAVEGDPGQVYEAAPLVLLGLRHLHAARRGAPSR